MHVSILICTRERPTELARCCASLAGLKFRTNAAPEIDVVIVDNTATGTTTLDQDELARLTTHQTRVVVEPQLGIPFARNTALANAHPNADYITFIDDDETAAPSWLDHLLTVADTCAADFVAGPALLRLPPNAIPAARALFMGQAAQFRGETGTLLESAATGNLLVDSRWLSAHPTIRLDEAMGLSRGSDTEWTSRAHMAGARIVCADRAIVWHWVSEQRASARWVDRRSIAVGHSRGLRDRRTMTLAQLTRRLARLIGRTGSSSYSYASARVRRETEQVAHARTRLLIYAGWWAGLLKLPGPKLYTAVTSEGS